MKHDSENLYIFIEVTGNDIVENLSDLLEQSGLRVSRVSSLDDLEKCVRDNPSMILRLQGDTDQNILTDMVSSLSGKSLSSSFTVITSKELSLLKKILKKPDWQHSEKQRNQKTLGEIEKEHIILILNAYGWKYKTAAKYLGIDRSTLYRKLKKYGIDKTK